VPAKTRNPSPAHEATDVPVSTVLSWEGGENATEFIVHYGTTEAMTECATTSGHGLDIGPLDPNTSYYWRVDATNVTGTAVGGDWCFGTAPPAPAKTRNPSPAHQAADVSLNATLSWKGGENAAEFIVHYGTTAEMTECATTTKRELDIGPLESSTSYYWRVDAKNITTTTVGDNWCFNTASPSKTRNPFPAHQAADVPLGAVLSWEGGEGSTSFTVRYGTTAAMTGCATTSGYELNIGFLKLNTKYYWRVDAVCDTATTTGDNWYFHTDNHTGPSVQIKSVSNTEIGKDVSSTITWEANENCSYTVEAGGNGTMDSGNGIASGSVTCGEEKITIIFEDDLPNNMASKVFIIVKNDADNETGYASVLLVNDQTAPEPAVLSPSDGSIVKSFGMISGTASDNVGKVHQVRISIYDGASYYSEADNAFTSADEILFDAAGLEEWWYIVYVEELTNGEYTIKAVAEDTVGLMGNAASTFTVNSSVPNVTITDPSIRYVNAGNSTDIAWQSDMSGSYAVVAGGNGSYSGGGVEFENGACTADVEIVSTVHEADIENNTLTTIYIYVWPGGNTSEPFGLAAIDIVDDQQTPSSAIIEPGNNAEFAEALPFVSGNASDSLSGVSHVVFSVKNTANNLFFNGTGFSADEHFFETVGAEVWYSTASLKMEPGMYALRAYAVDQATNKQSGPPMINFTIIKSESSKPDNGKHGSGPCFVATCCGASPDGRFVVRDSLGEHALSGAALADVRALRTFRDEVLSAGAFGRSIRAGYYAVGPVAAAAASESTAARAILRCVLIRPLSIISRELTGGSRALKIILLTLLAAALITMIGRRRP
jgi:hypothetical protein